MAITIMPGVRVRTLRGEQDTDSKGAERHTAPGTWGWVNGCNHADHWAVSFPGGARVVITTAELQDRAQYLLAEPQSMRQHCLALAYLQDVRELSTLDDEPLQHAIAITDDAAQIVALVGLLHEMLELHDDPDADDQDANALDRRARALLERIGEAP